MLSLSLLSERLTPLDIMGTRLKAPFKTLGTILPSSSNHALSYLVVHHGKALIAAGFSSVQVTAELVLCFELFDIFACFLFVLPATMNA